MILRVDGQNFKIYRSKALIAALSMIYAAIPASAETVSYTYDTKGRLVQVGTSGTGENSGVQISYRYDPNNNRLYITVSGSKNRGQQVVVVPLNGFTLIPTNP